MTIHTSDGHEATQYKREREMGCYPLGKILPRALRRRRGRKSYGAGKRRMYYSPPPPPSSPYSYRTPISFVNVPLLVVPSDPMHASKNQPPLLISPSPQAEMVQPSHRSRLRFAPGPDRFYEEEEEEGHHPGGTGPNRSREVVWPADRPSPGCRCMRWEDGDRRRGHFGGEFQYCPYPTPVREIIYNTVTDGNRITTVFSEENPNACSIT